MKMKSVLIPLATITGLVAGVFLNQVAKEGNILIPQVAKPVLAKSENAPPLKENPPPANAPVRRPSSAPENSLLRIKDYIKGLEDKNALLNDKVGLLTRLADSKEKEILKLKDDNAALDDALNKALETQGKLKDEFQVNLNNLNAQLSQKTAEAANLGAIRAYLENQINELNNKISMLSESSSALKNQLDQAQQGKDSLDAELNKVKDDLGNQMALNQTLDKNIDGLKEEAAAKERDRLSLVRELEQLGENGKKLQEELNELKIIKADNENQITRLNARINELDSLYAQAKDLNSQLKDLLADKDTQLRDRDTQLRDSQSTISSTKGEMDKFSAEKASLLSSLEEKEKGITELKSRLNEMESQMALLKNELTMEKGRYALLLEQLKNLSAVNNALKSKLRDIYTELELIRMEKIISNDTAPQGPKRSSAIRSGLDEMEGKAR
jgi:chromosome segregation ATPase